MGVSVCRTVQVSMQGYPDDILGGLAVTPDSKELVAVEHDDLGPNLRDTVLLWVEQQVEHATEADVVTVDWAERGWKQRRPGTLQKRAEDTYGDVM